MLNPKVHLICGICGCNHLLKYKVKHEIDDDTNEEIHVVNLYCHNCGTITSLDELMGIE